jgi:hypothetical protein
VLNLLCTFVYSLFAAKYKICWITLEGGFGVVGGFGWERVGGVENPDVADGVV